MYKIYADGTLIYDSTLDDLTISKGTITKEVNKSGSFVFTINADHPFYNRIQRLKTIITVYKRDKIVFRGRVITDGIGFFKDKTFTCEGELSFLLDSIQRPYTFTGSPVDLFKQFITVHNSQVDSEKQFDIGQVTIKDNNDYVNRSNSAYEDTLTNLNEHLVKTHEGYVHVTRGLNGHPVINWFDDYPYRSDQKIEFGENLLAFVKTTNSDEIVTAIIPLGKKLGSEQDAKRLTIESVNNGVDYIFDSAAVEKYGWIFKPVTWDDVTVAENLLTKGKAYLADAVKMNTTIELTAIDLSLMDKNIDSFELGDYITIVSNPHGIDDRLLLKKQTIDLLKPENDKITLGYTYSSFTDSSLSNNNQNSGIIKRVDTIEANYAVNSVVTAELESLQSLINQTSTSISSEVSNKYVSNDKLVSELSTVMTQLNNQFEFMFTSLEKKVGDNDLEYRDEFHEIKKYIRFENGDIVLGEAGNEIILRIENDILAFYEGNTQVAYLKNRKLYVFDGEFINSLKIGKFAFTPRENGNLSFKKVVE